MSFTRSLLIFLLLWGNSLFAQTAYDQKKLDALEKENNHEASVIELKKILASYILSGEEKLAIQIKLIAQYQQLQQWDSCLSYCQEQIVLARGKNNSLSEATFYKLIGNTYYYIPDKKKAVLYWEKSIDISEPNKYNVLLEQCYHNIGAYYLDYNIKLDIAEKYFIKSLQLGLVNNPANSVDNNRHYRLLATLYERTNQLQKAEKIYLEVIEKLKILKDTAELSETLMFYSGLFIKENKFEEALQVSAEALALAKKTDRLDLQQTALGFYATNLFSAGKFKEAYLVKNELENIVISRFTGDLNSKISEAEATFKNAEIQHEKEIALVKAKKEKQVYLLGFLTLLSIGGFVFYYLQQKRNIKQKAQMQQQVWQERERLSRDLHDNLGSHMALLSNTIESLDLNYKKHHNIEHNIENAKITSKKLLQTLRETIWILNKEKISTQDFFDKLIDHAHRYLHAGNGMRLEVKEGFLENKILNSNEALQLFRICQEAITNACKYSGTEILKISGKVTGHKFEIKISDNGKGFDANKITGGKSYGLINMQQRAITIHAILKIDAVENKGVEITVVL